MSLSKGYIDYKNSAEYHQIAQSLQNKVERKESSIGFTVTKSKKVRKQ